jgi:hypothetical protein
MSIDEQTEKRPNTTLPGIVQKIIKSRDPEEPDKAEIVLPDAEQLYQEIRIDNTFKDEEGKEVGLKPGAAVDVTIEADAKDTEAKDTEANAAK